MANSFVPDQFEHKLEDLFDRGNVIHGNEVMLRRDYLLTILSVTLAKKGIVPKPMSTSSGSLVLEKGLLMREIPDINGKLHLTPVPSMNIPLNSYGYPISLTDPSNEEAYIKEQSIFSKEINMLKHVADELNKSTRKISFKFFNLLTDGTLSKDNSLNSHTKAYLGIPYIIETTHFFDEYCGTSKELKEKEGYFKDNMKDLLDTVFIPYQSTYHLEDFKLQHKQTSYGSISFEVSMSTRIEYISVSNIVLSPYQVQVAYACRDLGLSFFEELIGNIGGVTRRVDFLAIVGYRAFIIEVDGSSHDGIDAKRWDEHKDRMALYKDLKTLRITNNDVLLSREYLERKILDFIKREFGITLK